MKWKLRQYCPMKTSNLATLKLLFCFALLWQGLVSCGQDFNSHSLDRPLTDSELDATSCESEAGARFCRAWAIYEKSCFACHRSWSHYKTEKMWINAGLIVAGDPASSKVIYRLVNAGSNMPPGSGALPQEDYQALLDWVKLIEN